MCSIGRGTDDGSGKKTLRILLEWVADAERLWTAEDGREEAGEHRRRIALRCIIMERKKDEKDETRRRTITMKRVLSLVLTASIAASLVPATAFAASGDVKATAKVVGAWTRNKDALGNGAISGSDVPELQLKVTTADYQQTNGDVPQMKVTVTLDNAKFDTSLSADKNITIKRDGDTVSDGVVDKKYYSYTQANDGDKTAILNAIYNNKKDEALKGYVVVDKAEKVYAEKESDSAMLKAFKDELDKIQGPTETKTAQKVREDWWTANASTKFGVTATDYDWGWYTDSTGKHEGYVLKAADPQKTPYFSLEELVKANDGKEFVAEYQNEGTWLSTNQGGLGTKNPKDFYDEKLAATITGGKILATVKTGEETTVAPGSGKLEASIQSVKDEEAVIIIKGYLKKDDVISIDLLSTMDKTSKNAKVSVDSKMVEANDLSYVIVADKAFSASVKKTVKIAPDEVVFLHDNGLKLKEGVKNSFAANDVVSLKLSKGFKFVKTDVYVNGEKASDVNFDGNELTFKVTDTMLTAKNAVDEDGLVTLTIKSMADDKEDGLKIESDGAKTGAKATITAKVGKLDKVSVEVAEVVDYKVVMSTDKDKDLPVIYSGTNVNNEGITDSSNHKTVEITLEETFPGAWSMRQGFNITLPDGVYVADVEVKDAENFFQNGKELGSTDAKKAWQDAFEKAYKDGDHKNFEFGKRVFDDVNVTLAKNPAKVTFVLVLVADPGFEGDVKVGFEGALVDKQSVSAAKFVVPYKVEAQQNDLKIDTRNTKIPTDIMVKETADGLWDKGKQAATFTFNIEKNLIRFEDDAKFTVDKNSGMEVTDSQKNNKLSFTVKSVSDKAATVTVSDMSLFMDRNIPAGKYALELNTTMGTAYDAQRLYANADSNAAADARDNKTDLKLKGDNYISDVTKYKKTVKDSFINVVTAPRDEDGFTTKITVPVGEKYVVAGEKKIEIDTPAYINDKGYTMLPLRAVAVALGIDNNSVLWDQNTRTATILYGNRVVSMQAGASTMYINGQAVATKAGVEITNDRTFLSLRDLGTAVNVKDISWDGATKTAYLNYGEKAAM